MFELKLVSNEYLKTQFDSIWKKVYLESNYELEDYDGDDVIRFILKHQKLNLYIGTLEVIFNYRKNGIKYEELFPFSKVEDIKSKLENTIIIQKVAILPNYQSQGYLERLLYAFYILVKQYNFSYGIALIEPKLFLALKIAYRVSIRKLGKKFFYKGDSVIPVIINLNEMYNSIDNIPWLKKIVVET